MSRGKPGADQLDLSLPMLDVLKSDRDMKSESGLDVRNYACLDGIHEATALIAGMVGAGLLYTSVLIGEPGVGKTAVVEGLAQRIVKGDVPEGLKDKKLFALDMGCLLYTSRCV